MSGWTLEGASARYTIPAGAPLRSGGYLVAKSLSFPLEGRVILRDADDAQVDFKDYHNPSCGRSVGRYPDGGTKWFDDLIPSPGGPNTLVTATAPAATRTSTRIQTATPRPGPSATPAVAPSATARATARTTPGATASELVTKEPTHPATTATSPASTASPSATLSAFTPTAIARAQPCLSEFLPAPRNVDWDGNGVVSYADEWIEVYNPGTEEIDLGGWQLDDRAGGGSNRYTFPVGEHVGAGSYGVYYQRQTGLALNNNGDDVRLVDPDGRGVDRFTYTLTAPDASYARRGGCASAWAMDQVPSPGGPNPGPHGLYLPLIYGQ